MPWSAEPTGLPQRLEQTPRSGWVLAEDVRLVPAPVHVRRDGAGELWVTNGAERVVRCAPPGVIELPGDCGPLLDLAVVDAGRYGLLDRVDGGTRLRWYDGAALAWQREGDFGKLLTDGRQVFTSERHGPAVYEWEPATGDPVRTLLRSPDAGEPFLVDGVLCAVFTDFAGGHRGVEQLDRDGTVHRTVLTGPEHYAWLVHPVGFDSARRPYAVRDGEVARIAHDGEIEHVGSVGDLSPRLLQVDPDGGVLFAVGGTDGVSVQSVRIGDRGVDPSTR
ncbi:hypothetical protein [Cellulomonas sp. NS3]|uniref:hypothetical protein n=1 Tax=Cellulomonas sp. NS3 TaxID=2973977 RepID=UPI002163D307|nr:hypothetical protein [Cellulomonas sp. NS3]